MLSCAYQHLVMRGTGSGAGRRAGTGRARVVAPYDRAVPTIDSHDAALAAAARVAAALAPGVIQRDRDGAAAVPAAALAALDGSGLLAITVPRRRRRARRWARSRWPR